MNENKQGSNYYLREIAEAIESNLIIIRDDRIVFANERFASLIGRSRQELAGLNITDLLFDDSRTQAFITALHHYEQGEYVLPMLNVGMVRGDGSIVHFRGRYGRMDWDDAPATFLYMNSITHYQPFEQRFLEFQELDTVMELVIRKILISSMSLDEIVPAMLKSVLSLTKSTCGFMDINNPGKKLVYEIKSDPKYKDCSLPDYFQRFLEDEKLMKKCRNGRIEGAFYLNERISIPLKDSGTAEVTGILRVPTWSPQGNDIDGSPSQLVLFNLNQEYCRRNLDHAEKVVEVFNLALMFNHFCYELGAAREKAERESEERSNFLMRIGHEIRSPLNGVMMMASFLSESELNEDQREQVNIMMFSARTIDRLVNDITHLTLLKTGKVIIQEEMFDFRELCRHIVETSGYMAREKGLEMKTIIDDGVKMVLGDRERISQILTNLVSNAVKYTNRGFVHLSAVEEDGMLRIEVADTGIGIRPEDRESIFNIYHQANEKTSIGGTGIGLYIVKELVQAMGGRIDLQSAEGEGSRFAVSLPLKPSIAQMVETDMNNKIENPPKSPLILVVEDESVSRLCLRAILEQDGYNVDEAANGFEAVDLAGKHECDLILMDVNMPLMGGLEAAARIKNSHPDIPIIAVTAYSNQLGKEEILNSGFEDIVSKPVDESDLRRRVARHLRK